MNAQNIALAPIGVFDSGVGGLTVARELIAHLGPRPMLYVADQLHVPYGGRPLAEVESFAHTISAFLLSKGASQVVMACNISSATALKSVRARFGHERIYGVIEFGARAALTISTRRVIGVLATQGTVATRAYTEEIARLAPDACVIERGCPSFVPCIEGGTLDGPELRAAAEDYLAPILAAGADTVILGCTHYPFLLPMLRALTEGRVVFVDPAQATARAVQKASGPTTSSETAHDQLFTTGSLAHFREQLPRFWPANARLTTTAHLDWATCLDQ